MPFDKLTALTPRLRSGSLSVVEGLPLCPMATVESKRRQALNHSGSGQAAAVQKDSELRDYLSLGLDVIFVGFNPGRISAQRGHYYANPQNAFWPLLFESGLVPIRLTCEEDHRLPEFGLGLTDLVKRATNSANDLRGEDTREGRPRIGRLLKDNAPRVVAFNGKGVYTRFFQRRAARYGMQPERVGESKVFVLPSTSPRNARVTRAEKLKYFRHLAAYVQKNHRRMGRPGGIGHA